MGAVEEVMVVVEVVEEEVEEVEKKKCKKGLLGAILCLIKKVVKAVGKGVKAVGKKLGFGFKQVNLDSNGDMVIYEYEPVDKFLNLKFKQKGEAFVYEKPMPAAIANAKSNMMQRPHEKMVCRMPDNKDSPPTPPSASPNASPLPIQPS